MAVPLLRLIIGPGRFLAEFKADLVNALGQGGVVSGVVVYGVLGEGHFARVAQVKLVVLC